MSADYVTFRQIQIRNQIQMPEVLRAVRTTRLNMQDLQDVDNPLNQVYQNTYKYLEYPGYVSPDERRLIKQYIEQNRELEKQILRNIQKPYPPGIHGYDYN